MDEEGMSFCGFHSEPHLPNNNNNNNNNNDVKRLSDAAENLLRCSFVFSLRPRVCFHLPVFPGSPDLSEAAGQ